MIILASQLFFEDNVDATKMIAIDPAGISPSTVRTIFMPDSNVVLHKDNLSSITPPSIGDDITDGYSAGSVWISGGSSVFVCASNAVGAAVWRQVDAGSALSDGDKGDITVSGSGTSWIIDPSVVTNAKLASMAAGTIKGAVSAGSPVDLTPAQARLILRRTKHTLAFNASQDWNLADGLYHVLSATSSFTLNFPSGAAEGETAFVYVTQAVGGSVVTFGGGFQAPGGILSITLTAAAGAVDRLEFFFDTATTATVTIAKGIA